MTYGLAPRIVLSYLSYIVQAKINSFFHKWALVMLLYHSNIEVTTITPSYMSPLQYFFVHSIGCLFILLTLLLFNFIVLFLLHDNIYKIVFYLLNMIITVNFSSVTLIVFRSNSYTYFVEDLSKVWLSSSIKWFVSIGKRYMIFLLILYFDNKMVEWVELYLNGRVLVPLGKWETKRGIQSIGEEERD